MMNYSEFKDYMKEHIKEFLPEEYRDGTVEIQSVYKNNDVILDSIRIKGIDEGRVVPVIYLNDSYKLYEGGESIDTIAEKLANFYVEHRKPNFNIDINSINSFDDVKEHIACRICNANSNKERLANAPHKIYADDLAITYHIIISKDRDGIASTMINNDMMSHFGVDVDTIHKIAVDNIDKIYNPKFQSMADMIKGLFMKDFMEQGGIDEEMAESMFQDMVGEVKDPMYVLSGENAINGATVIVSPDVLDMVSKKLDGDYYVIPSSTHEVIIVPKFENFTTEDLSAMVRDVNGTCVEPQDVLSDHVYEYDSKTKILRACVGKEHEQEVGEKSLEKSIDEKSLDEEEKKHEQVHERSQSHAKSI